MIPTKASGGRSESTGFTLIEILVATTISMMIVTAVYAAFRSSLKAYQRDETRIIMLQRCRSALDRVAKDIANLFYIADDEDLVLVTQDFADNETSMDKDMISFVGIVDPNLAYYVPQESSNSLYQQDEENTLPSDLARIAYYVGASPDQQNVQSLMRMETTELSTEDLEDTLDQLMSAPPSEQDQQEQGLQSSVLVDYIAGFNLRYFDGEDWIDEWDMEEQQGLPAGIEITVTISDADSGEKTITEATVVDLMMHRPADQQAGPGGAGQMPAMR